MKNGNMMGMKNTFIDRTKTALVVIDLQKGVVGRQTAPRMVKIFIRRILWQIFCLGFKPFTLHSAVQKCKF